MHGHFSIFLGGACPGCHPLQSLQLWANLRPANFLCCLCQEWDPVNCESRVKRVLGVALTTNHGMSLNCKLIDGWQQAHLSLSCLLIQGISKCHVVFHPWGTAGRRWDNQWDNKKNNRLDNQRDNQRNNQRELVRHPIRQPIQLMRHTVRQPVRQPMRQPQRQPERQPEKQLVIQPIWQPERQPVKQPIRQPMRQLVRQNRATGSWSYCLVTGSSSITKIYE